VSRYWSALAVVLFRRRFLVEDLDSLVSRWLKSDVENARSVGLWVSLWLLAWNYLDGSKRPFLIELAEINLRNHPNFSERHGDMFLYILREQVPVDRFFDVIVHWLDVYKRNSVVWCDLYLTAFSHRITNELLDVGMIWVSGWGGTVSAWLDIWRSLRPHMSSEEQVEIGIEWLNRARWDLRIWPSVFNDCGLLVHRNTRQIQKLVEVGRRWAGAQFGNRRSRDDVRRMVSYLETK